MSVPYDYTLEYQLFQDRIDQMTAMVAVLDDEIVTLTAIQANAEAAWIAAVRNHAGNAVALQATLAALSSTLGEKKNQRQTLLSSRNDAVEYLAKARAAGHGASLTYI